MTSMALRGVQALVAAVLLSSCGSAGSVAGGHAAVTPSPTTSASATRPAYVIAQKKLGTQPCAVVGGYGAVWVSLYGDDLVVRLDPRTLRVIARVHTDSAPCGLAIGAGAVWVMNYHANTVDRIDVRTNRVSARVKVGASPYDVTYAAGAAWVTNYSDNTVTRIDASTEKATTIPVGSSPIGIAHAGPALWVPNKGDGTISRIDATTRRATTLKVDGSPGWTAYAGTSVWVGNDTTHRVDRLDAVSGRVVATVPLPTTQNVNDGDVLGDRVYFPDRDGKVYAISRANNKLVSAAATGLTNPFTLAAYDGKLWVIDYLGTDIVELDPTRLPNL